MLTKRVGHFVEQASSFRVMNCNRGNQTWDFKRSYGVGAFAPAYLRFPMFEHIDD